MELILADLNKRLEDRDLHIELSDAAKVFIADNAYDPIYGARPLKRYMQKYVETLSAKLILSGDIEQGQAIFIDVAGDELTASIR